AAPAVKEFDPKARKKLTKSQITEIAKQRHEDATKSDKTIEMEKQWAKKKKEENKYLGDDENGKARFSGKSGDRNHAHDGTPRARSSAPKAGGKRISIKARKPKED
ncbi:hypothetical protein JHD47_08475, partial [Sulfurimonas sp. SAG-AH-194-L11]|nr:hypothetical protein [Sulfurimonas sp. SAG-AH-194-L11]